MAKDAVVIHLLSRKPEKRNLQLRQQSPERQPYSSYALAPFSSVSAFLGNLQGLGHGFRPSSSTASRIRSSDRRKQATRSCLPRDWFSRRRLRSTLAIWALPNLPPRPPVPPRERRNAVTQGRTRHIYKIQRLHRLHQHLLRKESR